MKLLVTELESATLKETDDVQAQQSTYTSTGTTLIEQLCELCPKLQLQEGCE
jgi:hypothetical protein